jgi:hypothetical protein
MSSAKITLNVSRLTSEKNHMEAMATLVSIDQQFILITAVMCVWTNILSSTILITEKWILSAIIPCY